jgi:hypothetical protein
MSQGDTVRPPPQCQSFNRLRIIILFRVFFLNLTYLTKYSPVSLEWQKFLFVNFNANSVHTLCVWVMIQESSEQKLVGGRM